MPRSFPQRQLAVGPEVRRDIGVGINLGGEKATVLASDVGRTNSISLRMGTPPPLRLRVENQLGYKMVKWIERIEFIASEKLLGAGEGGKNEDDEYFDLLPNI